MILNLVVEVKAALLCLLFDFPTLLIWMKLFFSVYVCQKKKKNVLAHVVILQNELPA